MLALGQCDLDDDQRPGRTFGVSERESAAAAGIAASRRDAAVAAGDGGIDGGEAPYGDFASWSGQFEGRYYLYAKAAPRPDTAPPPAVNDLRAVPGGGRVLLKWTAPPDAARQVSTGMPLETPIGAP